MESVAREDLLLTQLTVGWEAMRCFSVVCLLSDPVSKAAVRTTRFTIAPGAPSCPLAWPERGALIIN